MDRLSIEMDSYILDYGLQLGIWHLSRRYLDMDRYISDSRTLDLTNIPYYQRIRVYRQADYP